jgi:hypothetical protein
MVLMKQMKDDEVVRHRAWTEKPIERHVTFDPDIPTRSIRLPLPAETSCHCRV